MNLHTEPLASAAQHCYSALDSAVVGVVTSCTMLISWILAVSSPTGMQDELKQLLVPLIGAMITSGAMIMFNPKAEHRKIVIGRSMFALLFGCATPQISALVLDAMGLLAKFEGFDKMLAHPVMLLIGGAIAAIGFYAVSYPFCRGLYKRSDDIADYANDELVERIGMKSTNKQD